MPTGRLHQYHKGAKVAQQLAAIGAGHPGGDFHDRDAFECLLADDSTSVPAPIVPAGRAGI